MQEIPELSDASANSSSRGPIECTDGGAIHAVTVVAIPVVGIRESDTRTQVQPPRRGSRLHSKRLLGGCVSCRRSRKSVGLKTGPVQQAEKLRGSELVRERERAVPRCAAPGRLGKRSRKAAGMIRGEILKRAECEASEAVATTLLIQAIHSRPRQRLEMVPASHRVPRRLIGSLQRPSRIFHRK